MRFKDLISVMGCAALLAACAPEMENQHRLPIPSAARGGVAPAGMEIQPMHYGDVSVVRKPEPSSATDAASTARPAAALVPQVPAPPVVELPLPPETMAVSVDLPKPPVFPVSAPASVPAAVSALPRMDSPSFGAGGGYVLGIGDAVRLTVYGEEDLSGQYEVGSTGMVALPLIGNVQAAGQTLDQLTFAIQQKLAQGYLKDPRVSIQVANYRPFFILGEVAKPGSYPYVNGMTVLSAVATAGGYTYRADKDDVRVVHANANPRQEQEIDQMSDILPGDIIRVTERFF